jgi:hypothetical protein
MIKQKGCQIKKGIKKNENIRPCKHTIQDVWLVDYIAFFSQKINYWKFFHPPIAHVPKLFQQSSSIHQTCKLEWKKIWF